MCTAIVLYRAIPDLPLVIAANRDEFYNRPASPPAVWLAPPGLVAGVDQKKGGTWLGVRAGRFVALVTNQAPESPVVPPLSRGDIVAKVLELGEHDAARAYLEALDSSRYRGFNLLFGDAQNLSVAYAREGTAAIEFESVSPGIHVLPNARMDDPNSVKVAAVRAALPAVTSDLDVLRRILTSHDAPAGPLSALCVHTPFYGTVSTQLVALSEAGVARHLYGAGPTCLTTLTDLTSLHST